jgi:sugar phosphate isomerase/epimerase
VGLHWLLVKPEGLYLNHTNSVIRARTANYFVDLVDCCADFGGKIMVVGSPKQRNLLPGVSGDQAWEWTAATFRDAVKRAEDRGVTICFEPLSPAETNFINTAAAAIEFVKPFKSPAIPDHSRRESDVFRGQAHPADHPRELAALRALPCE